ncbi:S-layer homology domain-containing protein [Candidatus Gracilibacteria bacterium]|nr:S-layer homology domain-containing protein [Candidatus Gracilibacteria bacterium]MCF7856388.1 S-layer homology domain-containing protein [Candidatus Gracilibacteria bacterium]MCF7896816.1 S-layer homology domain-containing protein [Candidatus Gracilibacteria bacterium]
MRTPRFFRKVGSAIVFVILIFNFPSATAVQFYSPNVEDFVAGDPPRIISPITITAQSAAEITAEFGIQIKVPEGLRATFDRDLSFVSFSGSAVTGSAIVGAPTDLIALSRDLRNLSLTVARDFLASESLVITGLKLRVYDTGNSVRYLELHLDDSGVYSAQNINGVIIEDTNPNTDNTPPYPVDELTATQISGNRVKLSWINPPDLDTSRIAILRIRTREGVTRNGEFETGVNLNTINQPTEFIDDDVQVGDQLTYELRSRDARNQSEPATVSITLVVESEIPIVCTTDYTPVCGSDGVTYSNLCNAEAAGIISTTAGECVTENDVIPPTEQPPLTSDEKKASEAGITLAQLQNAIAQYSDLAAAHWSAGFLARLNSDKIIDGYPDGTIQPDTTINRAELAKIAVNSFALDNSTVINFSDVPTGAWFTPFVGALAKVGAVWTTSTEFYPADGVSRGEAVWTLLTAAGVEIPAASEKPFPDVSLSHPYAAAIAWAKDHSIINGYDDGTFGLRDTLTRAQVAKIVVLLKNNLAQ